MARKTNTRKRRVKRILNLVSLISVRLLTTQSSQLQTFMEMQFLGQVQVR